MSGWRQLIITAQLRKMSRIPKSFLLFQTQMIITYYFHCCSDTLQKHPIRNLNDYAQTTTQPSPLTTSHSLRPSRLRMPSCRKPLQPTLPYSSTRLQSTIHFLKNTRLSNPPKFKVGDRVRLSKLKRVFKKSYLKGYTDEVFMINDLFLYDIL